MTDSWDKNKAELFRLDLQFWRADYRDYGLRIMDYKLHNNSAIGWGCGVKNVIKVVISLSGSVSLCNIDWGGGS